MAFSRSGAVVGATTVFVLTSALTACGGGGGGGPSPSPNSGPGDINAPSSVTETNAARAASIAVGAAELGAGSFGMATMATSGPGMQTTSVAKATQTFDLPCTTPGAGGNGSLSMVFNDADNTGEASAGDTVTLTFNQCRFPGDVETTNGTINFGLTQVSGDPGPGSAYAMAGSMTFTNLSIISSVPGESGSMNGQLSFNAVSTDGVVETGKATLSDLTVTLDGGETARFSNFVVDFNNNHATNTSTASQNGVVVVSGVGALTVAQQEPWVSLMEADYPMSGSVKITATDNTNVVVTALGGAMVKLDIDTDGNGTVDRSITDTWANLDDL